VRKIRCSTDSIVQNVEVPGELLISTKKSYISMPWIPVCVVWGGGGLKISLITVNWTEDVLKLLAEGLYQREVDIPSIVHKRDWIRINENPYLNW
jgi:hypothetical protein